MALASVVSRALLPVVLLCASASTFAQPSERQALADAIYAANEQLRLELGRDQVRAHQFSPEVFKQREAEINGNIARVRGRWAGTPQRSTFDNAYSRALKDPVYRSQALAEYDQGGAKGAKGATLSLPAFSADSLWKIAGYIIFGAIALVVLGVLWAIIQKSSEAKPPPKPVKPDDTYGSADWAVPYDGPPNADYVFNGVFFGKASLPDLADLPLEEHTGGPVCSEKKSHVLICAQTRTGKGTMVLCPTLLRAYPKTSMFVIDPKGENAAISSRVRRSLPSDVHIINPWGEWAQLFQQYGFKPATYNPLDILDRNDPNVVSVAKSMAAAICPPETGVGGKDPYWNNNAAAILAAVLLWLTDNPKETKTLARAREIITRSKKDFQDNYLCHMAASPAFNGAINELSARFVGMAADAYSGILSNAQQHTDFLSDPQIKAATAASSFSMKDLLTKPTTVYVVIPFDLIDTQRTWLRMLITAGMHTYKRHRSSNVNRCLFLIDELPALGHIEELPRDIATMSGYGVDFVLTIQNLSQLRDAYGDKGSGAILSNCAYKWFCNLDDLHTAEILSKTLGNKTVDTKGGGTTVNMGPGGGSTSTSTNYGKTGRPLLMPDEILQLGRNTAILLGPNSKPRYLRTVDYWNLTKAFAHLEKRYPSMYWKPPITWDENPFPH